MALAITLVVLVSFATVGYTVYADVSNVVNTVGGSAATSLVTTTTVVQGSATVFYLNVTLTNTGLYPIIITLVCQSSAGIQIVCTSPSVTVLPRQSQTLHFIMTAQNYSQSAAGGLHVDGQMEVVLEPFASVNLTVDLGTLVARGEL